MLEETMTHLQVFLIGLLLGVMTGVVTSVLVLSYCLRNLGP